MSQSPPLGDWPDLLAASGHWPRGALKVWHETDSTQDLARTAARSSGLMACGTVFLARHQRHGRGRLGRAWQAPPGSALLFSLVAPPCNQPEALSLAIPVALHRALSPLISHELAIKWPNDLLAPGQGKLAGILIETENGLPVIGIGLNTTLSQNILPEDLRSVATSTHMLGANTDDFTLLATLLKHIDQALDDLQAEQLDTLRQDWRSACRQIGQQLKLTHAGQPIEGELLDVDPLRGLLLRLSGGELIHLPSAGTTTR